MDLFEYMKQQLGCNFTSDLHYHQQEVLCLFQKTDCSQYSTRELDDFCQYVLKWIIRISKNMKDYLIIMIKEQSRIQS